MAYAKISSGLIQGTSFPGSSLPAWLTAVTGGGGTVTVADGVCVCSADAGGKPAYIYTTNALTAETFDVRVKVKMRNGPGEGIIASCFLDAASAPTGQYSWGDGTVKAVFFYSLDNDNVGYGLTIFNTPWLWNGGANDRTNYYIEDSAYELGDIAMYHRNSSMVLNKNSGITPEFANDPFWMGGCLRDSGYGLVTYDYVQILSSLIVDVGSAEYPVEEGYVVKLYNSGDTLLATGSAASDNVCEIDCTGVEFGESGLTGYFKVFDEGDEEVRRLPAEGNFTGLYGGDVWPGLVTWTITASAGAHGDIDPIGEVIVIDGEDQDFDITPDPHYESSDIIVDSVSTGPGIGYDFVGVHEDHTIAAEFEAIIWTIVASAGENGSIDPSGDVEVYDGLDKLFTFTPSEGYQVDDVLVDGGSVGSPATYNFTGVVDDHIISVTFTETASSYLLRMWDGADWSEWAISIWNGSSWIWSAICIWDGAQWVIITQTSPG